MNYFEFYGIPESFNIDENVVKQKFYELSKTYHPDFYINHSEEKQQEILELSTLNNKAYQVLFSPQKRMEYILQSHGHAMEGEKYQLPQDFLMEMMEVNEALMDLEFDNEEEKIHNTLSRVAEIEQELQSDQDKLTNLFDTADEETRQGFLERIKDIYYRQKYLLRIRESLNKFTSR